MDFSSVPVFAAQCCEVLTRAGHEAVLVGGCVRDLLLGRSPDDWDVATSAPPETVRALFPKTVPTGLRHGTVTVLLPGGHVEVTTFRREGGYSDGRRPDAVFFDAGLYEDLSRRDFTVNAMALSPGGTLFDPFDGRGDLNRRLVRCVGAPEARFSEDGLRMFRAVRFAAQLGFSIGEKTKDALFSCARMADRVSGERIAAELEKILLSARPELSALLVDAGLLARFGAPGPCPDLEGLRCAPETPEDRWLLFCRTTGLEIARLPVSRALRRAVQNPDRRAIAALALTGGELYALGLRGAEIAAAQKALLAYVREHPAESDRQALLRALKHLGGSAVTGE